MTPAKSHSISHGAGAGGSLQVAEGTQVYCAPLRDCYSVVKALHSLPQLSVFAAERLAFPSAEPPLEQALRADATGAGAASRNTQDLDLVSQLHKGQSAMPWKYVWEFIKGGDLKEKKNSKTETEIEEGHSDP